MAGCALALLVGIALGERLTLRRRRQQSSRDADGGGFRMVHFFNGEGKPLQRYKDTSYSQSSAQDLLVKRLFREKKRGFFVDLAANDAVHMSNTFVLERDLGWQGLCVEANSRYLWRLAARQCQVVAAVVSGKDNKVVDFSFRGADSGIVAQKAIDSEMRSSVTLATILERFNAPPTIDYLSLDVEGAEQEILEAFPFSTYQFLVLTVERPSRELQQILRQKGFHFLRTAGNFGDLAFIHEMMPGFAGHQAEFNPFNMSGVHCTDYNDNQPTKLWEWCLGNRDEIERAKPAKKAARSSALDYFKKRLATDVKLIQQQQNDNEM